MNGFQRRAVSSLWSHSRVATAAFPNSYFTKVLSIGCDLVAECRINFLARNWLTGVEIRRPYAVPAEIRIWNLS